MNQKIREIQNGQCGNYILPFFWQHGEEEPVLREYMAAIQGCGIGAVCVEARPHPDYLGEGWWHDLDLIMEEAKNRDMKVWVLDDGHYPTGQAGGAIAAGPEELRKKYLQYNMLQVCGPVPQCRIYVEAMAHKTPSMAETILAAQGGNTVQSFGGDRLLGVVACEMDGQGTHLSEKALVLTDIVRDGILTWDVPKGMWRIFVLYETRNGGGNPDYINLLSRKSCKVLLDTVYEAHYQHYGEEFGKTFAGFFSDEPGLGNVYGNSTDVGIGNPNLALPWSDEMPELMEMRFGKGYEAMLPALWQDVGAGEYTARIRVGYMDIVTKLVQQNFSEQIGDWCRAHGVEYIGHIIEDNDMSCRLGSSVGHFFRGLWGQDMSGIDVIGWQISPGGEDRSRRMLGTEINGQFYHNTLAKLGSSLAHLDPKKQGRTMCELFGAFGWSLGMRQMKYLVDHLLVRGVNWFVPHAFSAGTFPDRDCPPHFYAHGENPLYRPFGHLMRYLNRMSHLFNGGKAHIPVALLYHAEAEWSGMEFDTIDRIAGELLSHQMDFDILPIDALNGRLPVSAWEYRILILPYMAYPLPGLEDALKKIQEQGTVLYMACEKGQASPFACVECISREELPHQLRELGVGEASCSSESRGLRILHYEQKDAHFYLVTNEDVWNSLDEIVFFPMEHRPYGYDAMEDRIVGLEACRKEDGWEVPLHLEPYGSLVIVFDKNEENTPEPEKEPHQIVQDLSSEWMVSFAENKNYPDFQDSIRLAQLENIMPYKPGFSGIIRYEKEVYRNHAGDVCLELEDAWETAEVWCNGQYVGMRICPPYRFDLSNVVQEGSNLLRIEVATTLEEKVRSMNIPGNVFAMGHHVEVPAGILGKVLIKD